MVSTSLCGISCLADDAGTAVSADAEEDCLWGSLECLMVFIRSPVTSKPAIITQAGQLEGMRACKQRIA